VGNSPSGVPRTTPHSQRSKAPGVVTSCPPSPGKPILGRPPAAGTLGAIPASGTINIDTEAPQTSQSPTLRSPSGFHPLHATPSPFRLRFVPVTPPGACRSGWLSSRLSAPAASAWPFAVAMTAMVTSLTQPVARARAARHSPYVTSGVVALGATGFRTSGRPSVVSKGACGVAQRRVYRSVSFCD
jgi:hypothetical protein